MTIATFQSTVNISLGFGVVGELIIDGPHRVEPLNLDLNGGQVGYVFTKNNSTNVATQGGTIGNGVVFAGILVNPKVYASFGPSSGNPIDPTLTLTGYTQAEFMQMGTIVGYLPATANIGDFITYNTTTGALGSIQPYATFTGVVAVTTGVLTVSAVTSTGLINIGTNLNGTNVPYDTIITSQLSGTTGGAGTYQTNITTAVASTAMTAGNNPPAGYALVPNAYVYRYPTTGAGLVAVRITD